MHNVTMAKLTKKDLKSLKDKNLIKLFKLGQLSVEYLLFSERYYSKVASQMQTTYQGQFDKVKDLEE